MNTLAKNLKHLRLSKGLSQKALAQKLNVSQAAIYYWENGKRSPDILMLERISKLFNINMSDLLGVSEDIPSKAVRIPVFGSVPAGVPTEAIEDIIDFEDIPREWTDGNREYFGLKVKGASMYPKYLENDTVIVRKQSDCESGQDCIVYVNGYDATLKRVLKQTDGIMLQPLNPEYAPVLYPYEEGECEVKIAGVVVEIRRKV